MLPKNYPLLETAKARFAALKIPYIVSMINGCKHGINGETSSSKLVSMSGLRVFSRRMSECTRRACFYLFNLLLCVCFMAKGGGGGIRTHESYSPYTISSRAH